MGGSSKKTTVGYRYYMGLHFGICHGPVDSVQEVIVGERLAWNNVQATSGSLVIASGELFGGDKREGGVEGVLDVMMGEPAQATNSYLADKIGAGIPAFRGILSAVWRGGLVTSNNPYVKPWSFKVKRILQGWAGGSAWYSEKAAIITYTDFSLPVDATGWEYQEITHHADPGYDNLVPPTSGWSSGQSPFAGGTLSASGNTNWTIKTILWAKKTFVVPSNKSVLLRVSAENGCVVFSNGLLIGSVNRDNIQIDNNQNNFVYVPLMAGSYEILIKAFDEEVAGGGTFLSIESISDAADMNPAHIIYQCLTDTDWGMGYPTGAIDAVSFTAAADALYSEGFGLSMMWNQQDTIESFISIVLDHIGAMLYVMPDTGTFALKLIRADYDRGTLPLYGVTNLVSADDYQRQAWGETVNEITVVYTDHISGKDTSVTVQDAANIITQGGVVSQTRNYHGIHIASLAQRVAQRDLNAASTPLARIKLTATRAAWAVFPGDVFRLTWPEFGIADVVYRCLQVNRGTLQDGQIIIDAVEDVFGMPSNTYLVDQPSEWEDPSNPPAVAPYRILIEAPYWDLIRNLSAADMSFVDSLSGYLETLAVRPSSDATNYSLYARTGSADYTQRGNGDFCPTATVIGALTKTTTAITLENGIDLDLVEVGGYAVIGNEYVLVSAIDWMAGTATIARGVLDTVPVAHAAGSRLWFADGWQGFDTTEYADGEEIDVKLRPITGRGELALASAPVDSLTFDQRQYRPYPPGKVRFDTLEWPAVIEGSTDVVMTWAHRDRTLQTAYIVEQDEASIGPEAGVTYSLEVADESLTVLYSATGISGTTATVPASSLASGLLRFRLWSVRGGLISWQIHEHFAIWDAVRITEAGEARITEAGDYRITE